MVRGLSSVGVDSLHGGSARLMESISVDVNDQRTTIIDFKSFFQESNLTGYSQFRYIFHQVTRLALQQSANDFHLSP